MTAFRSEETRWRTAQANRVAILIASEAYFAAVYEAIQKAEHSILLLGWTFDPRTRLTPDGLADPSAPDEIGRILLRLSEARPDLDIRLLIWKSALPVAATQDFFPHAARKWFKGTRIKFRLDDEVPFGACHHQKVVVIDDRLAFCGGGDISVDRWDSWHHLPEDLRRILPTKIQHAPRHEVMMMVDGDAARSLGDHVRDRWRRLGEPGPAPAPENGLDLWPGHVPSLFVHSPVAIARTMPAWHGSAVIEEIRALTLDCIARAREAIYLENQYFTSPLITEALAARLAEPDGPEVVLISSGRAPSWFDRLTMDRARAAMITRLSAADVFGRFRALYPTTSGGGGIIVHSKCSIFDDRIVRVGSANLNNRSFGFDSECELAVECQSDAARRNLLAFRDKLVGHFIGVTGEAVANARTTHGGLVQAIDMLNSEGRLVPIAGKRPNALDALIAAYHIGDPAAVSDSWRLGRRRRRLALEAGLSRERPRRVPLV